MKSDSETYDAKRKRALRFQAVIDDDYDTLAAFQELCRRKNQRQLAVAVEKWVPPQRRYHEKPRGAAVTRIDWELIRMPEGASLRAFCMVTGASADHLLFGTKPRYRSRTRAKRELAADLADYVRTVLEVRGVHGELHAGARARAALVRRWTVDGAALLKDVVELEAARISAYATWFYGVGPLQEGTYIILDALRRLAPFLPVDAPADQAVGLLVDLAEQMRTIVRGLPAPPPPRVMPAALKGLHLRARTGTIGDLIKELAGGQKSNRS